MNTYIDESGTFVCPAPLGSWNVISALVVPEHTKRHLIRTLDKFKLNLGFPRHAELKLSAIQENSYVSLLSSLSRLDLILFAVVTDCGTTDLSTVQHHKAMQVQSIRIHAPEMVYEAGRMGVENLANSVENLPPQLYTQMVCQTELIHDVLSRGILYYAQRTPQTLAQLRWRIDEKNSARPSFERTFEQIAPALLQTKSLVEPIIMVRGFDYRHFEHYEHTAETMPKHVELPDGESLESGLDLKRILNEDLRFVDSKREPGIQVADLLATGLRRVLRAQFVDNQRVAELLGSMMTTNKRGEHAIHLVSLAEDKIADPAVSQVVHTMNRHAKNILK